MSDELVTIREYVDYIEAELAKQMLDDCGIRTILSGENATNVYGGMPAFATIKLMTRASQAEEAGKILESQAQRSEPQEPDEFEDEQEET